MDHILVQQGLEFEWDVEKASSNLEKHGVSFEDAAEAFLDPFHRGGNASESGEFRQFIIGYTTASRLALVVFVERSPRVRIISARPATRRERKAYEDS